MITLKISDKTLWKKYEDNVQEFAPALGLFQCEGGILNVFTKSPTQSLYVTTVR